MPLHRDDPKSVGGYKLVDRLGAGGMGVVYRGRARSGREVAVKVVHAQYAADGVFRARFRQEIEAVRKVSGAFTAPVVDADPEAARPWMATQYVPGRSLAQRIRDRGPLRDAELRQLALGLVEALRDIHRAGVVHRDLKPANVMMAEDGPRVIDFGISRAAENQTLTETGQMIGTPPFMSPEQLTDARTVGPASDVFSLGALLVYAVTGRGPFDTDSPYLTAYRVVHDEPVLDGVDGPLRTVLERCLAKDEAERPGLDELGREFATVLPEGDAGDLPTVALGRAPQAGAETRPGTVADPGGDGRPGLRSRIRPLWAATGTVGAIVLGLTAYLLIGPGQADGQGAGLPQGWKPWQTTVYESAPRGAKKAMKVHNGTEGGPECLVHEDAVYCGGDGVLPVRLDGRTGKTVWRAGIAPSGTDSAMYSAYPLGVRDGVVLVQQQIIGESTGTDPTDIIALDAETGERLWRRTVSEGYVDMTFSGGVVVTPDKSGRSLVALSPRTGAERWTKPLPANHYCAFTEAGEGLYLECLPETTEPRNHLILQLNPTDGSTRRLTGPSNGGLLGVLDGRLLFLLSTENEGGEELVSEEARYDRILLVHPVTGARSTTKLAKEYAGQVTLVDGTLWFAASSGRVTAVSARTGKPLRQTSTSLELPSLPTYDPRTRAVYLASASGRVAALDAREGTLLWETLPRAEKVSSGLVVEPEVLLQEGALVVTIPDGTVFSLDPAHPERKSVSG
ncbi:protein kinase domain-containing protein [Streptomyces yerevanensis]|uniref:serine/threonine-protein kinase n=1 Tax=Streptomyces yerevanensis TaxID=66378 RepID=UPI0005267BD1|nr:serine/threonine-protein kinase [Streptomyces yerevanensis]